MGQLIKEVVGTPDSVFSEKLFETYLRFGVTMLCGHDQIKNPQGLTRRDAMVHWVSIPTPPQKECRCN